MKAVEVRERPFDFMGGWKIFREKKIQDPIFQKKISRIRKVLLYALYNLRIKRQDRVADEKNILAKKHLPAPPIKTKWSLP